MVKIIMSRIRINLKCVIVKFSFRPLFNNLEEEFFMDEKKILLKT